MSPDSRRLLAVMGVSLLFGLLIGRPFMALSAGLLILLVWYYRALAGFVNYVRHGAEDNLYDLPGTMNELTREFHILRSHYLQREEKLSGLLIRFQEAAAALPDAIVVLNKHGMVEWANPKSEEYLGIRWPQDANRRISHLVRHPDLAALFKTPGRETGAEVIDLISATNEQLRLEVRLSSYGGAYTLLVARDITALHRLNEMRKDFVANASHELRTPLTVITGYLEALDEDASARPAGEWRSRIAQMRKQAGRMQRLIDDLLTLSTIENESVVAEGEEIQVAELAAIIQKEAQTLSGDAGHNITLEADPELRLKGLHRDIYSAFSNIVCNAVQYTPPGGRIAIHWYGDEDGGHLAVSDAGEGIAPEHIPRLTERFYRVDKGRSRLRGGTGLGLAIVRHVLARHDATLEIKSEPGKGSTFTCHFPAQRVIRRQDARRLPKSA